jgi:hypothetical protein
MKFKPFLTWLEQQGAGTDATDLFGNEIPSDCKNGVALLDTYRGVPIDHYLPGYKHGGFRAVVRSTDYLAGQDRAYALVALLTVQQETQLDGLLIKLMLPIAEPRSYRRSVGGFWEFEFEVDVCFIDTP